MSLPAPRREPPYGAIVFDCDSTLSALEGIEDLARGRSPEVRAELAALTERAMAGELALEEVFARRLTLVAPTRAEVQGLAAIYAATAVSSAAAVCAALRALGKRVLVVSGGLLDGVRPFAQAFLGVDEVHAVGAHFGPEGEWLGHDTESPLARSGGKPSLLRALFPDGDVALVGDGATDAEAVPAVARFVAFGGVVARSAALARGDAVVLQRDLAAVLPSLCSPAELDTLAATEAFAGLVVRARSLEKSARPALWIPGPTEVRPELLAATAGPMFGHRSKAMTEVLERIDVHLPTLFGLDPAGSGARCAVHSCTASGLMEAALRGVVGDGRSKVLCLVNGSFSGRFAEMCRALELEHVVLERPPGEAFTTADLAEALARHGPLAAVTFSASETSTGAATPPARLSAALEADPEVLLIGDFVTWLGGAPVDFDTTGLDFALAGTQKALALPPGLAVCAVSERYLARARGAARRSWFLDPVRVIDAHAARNPPMTPTISLHLGLAKQLEDIAAGTLERALSALPGQELPPAPRPGAEAFVMRYARHAAFRDRVRSWAASVGLRVVPAPAETSPTVACLAAAEGATLDPKAMVQGLTAAGFEVGGGYGALASSTFRIGHMGDHSRTALERLLAAAEGCLRRQRAF